MRRSRALVIVIVFLAISAGAATRLEDFRIEASSDSLVLEDDPAMAVYDRSRVTFGNDETVYVTVTRDDLFTPEGIAYIRSLTATFAAIDGVASADAITEVRLFQSEKRPPTLFRLIQGGSKSFPKLDDKRVVIEKARAELLNHRLYAGNYISRDGRTAAILVTLELGAEHLKVMDRYLTLKSQAASWTGADRGAKRAELAAVTARYNQMENERKDVRVRIVRDIRAVMRAEQEGGADIISSGVPSIIVDMVDYINDDLRVFGLASIGFLALFLAVVFRRIRWVILPLASCLGTALWIIALFVIEGKKASVVTCNIPSLLVVIGLAHALHLIIRYREEMAKQQTNEVGKVLRPALRSILVPCFYTALTTGVGFLSLIVAGIQPVVDFGIHMALGVVLAFALSFVVLPAALSLLRPLPMKDASPGWSGGLVVAIGRFALRFRGALAAGSALVMALSIVGITKLDAETKFIDYFQEDSRLYRGLYKIDRDLGGTTLFEVILTSPEKDFFKTPKGLEAARAASDFLSNKSQVGNVLGLPSMVDQVSELLGAMNMPRNEDMILGRIIPNMLPEEQLRAYVNADWSEVRIVSRVQETAEDLRRSALIEEVRAHLKKAYGTPELKGRVGFELTGMFVLYTNMLESLTGSQWTTALMVGALIFLTTLVVFRDFVLAIWCMIPNLLPIVMVLGTMGWLGIHLDMATVMIASIALGIAIDGTIHYTFRFREELAKGGDSEAAVLRSHASIGLSIFYTTLTSIAGFWVLALSHFKPNVYFGIFTGLAMIIALFGDLVLLPIGLTWVKPFVKKDKAPAKEAA